jgi:hypothetical protein
MRRRLQDKNPVQTTAMPVFPKNNLTGRPLITDNVCFGLSGRMW